jgi:hypothetical protein
MVGRPLLVKIPKPDRLDLDVSGLLLDIPISILYSSFRTTQLFTGLHTFYPLPKRKLLRFSQLANFKPSIPPTAHFQTSSGTS